MPEGRFENEKVESEPTLPVMQYEDYERKTAALEELTDWDKNEFDSLLTGNWQATIENGPENLKYVDEIVTRGVALSVTTRAVTNPVEGILNHSSPEETGGYRVNVSSGLVENQEIVIRTKDRELVKQIHIALIEQVKKHNESPKDWLLEMSDFADMDSPDYPGEPLLVNS